MLFFVVLGGAAVLEVHRALHHHGNGDLKQMREKEAELRKQLQELQKDLSAAQSQRQLTEQEAAALAAVNERLSEENAGLAAQASSLRTENEALMARADSLLERQQALEACAESLKLENSALIQQFDRLKVKYQEESVGFQEQLADLKAAVAGALSRFTQGELSADQLVAFLSQMGVELRCRKEDLESLPEQLNSARSREERLKLLDRAEVDVSDSWLQQMRLISAEPDRAARLLMAGAAAARGAQGSGTAAGRLLEAAEAAAGAAAGAASTSTASLPFSPPKKLPTPPKERATAQLPPVKVPPLKLGGIGSALAAAAAGGGQDENTAANVDAAVAAAAVLGDRAGAAAGAKGKKAGTMRFLPGKKPIKKQAAPLSATPQLALEVPLGQGSTTSRMCLPFDADCLPPF